jgi:hypothetical protein
MMRWPAATPGQRKAMGSSEASSRSRSASGGYFRSMGMHAPMSSFCRGPIMARLASSHASTFFSKASAFAIQSSAFGTFSPPRPNSTTRSTVKPIQANSDVKQKIQTPSCNVMSTSRQGSNGSALSGGPRGSLPQRLPQIRTCAIDASGSSNYEFATGRFNAECTTRGLLSGKALKIAVMRCQLIPRLFRRLNHLCQIFFTRS